MMAIIVSPSWAADLQPPVTPISADVSADVDVGIGISSNPVAVGIGGTGVGIGGSSSASAWSYSPSAAIIDQSGTTNYGTILMGQPQSPVMGSYSSGNSLKGRVNLKSGVEIVAWELPSTFTEAHWESFKQSVVNSRGQEFWDDLQRMFKDPTEEGLIKPTVALYLPTEGLPEIEGVKVLLQPEVYAGLIPGVDYVKVGGVQMDGLSEEAKRQLLIPFALKIALDNNIPVAVLQQDSHLRAGLETDIDNFAWSLGLGMLFPGNTPIMVGPGIGNTGTTEIDREIIFAGTGMGFIVPVEGSGFWKTVYGNRAETHSMTISELTGRKNGNGGKVSVAPISELAK